MATLSDTKNNNKYYIFSVFRFCCCCLCHRRTSKSFMSFRYMKILIEFIAYINIYIVHAESTPTKWNAVNRSLVYNTTKLQYLLEWNVAKSQRERNLLLLFFFFALLVDAHSNTRHCLNSFVFYFCILAVLQMTKDNNKVADWLQYGVVMRCSLAGSFKVLSWYGLCTFILCFFIW